MSDVLFVAAPATADIYTLSLHDALPISNLVERCLEMVLENVSHGHQFDVFIAVQRSEEHTSELQSRFDLVCRLLLEKKNHTYYSTFLGDRDLRRSTGD